MKKFVLPLLSGLLVVALLLGSFVTAKAAPGDDPTVTPVSGDTDFMTEVVAIASLPGTVELAGGMLAPVGFSDGEAQFGGNGILVTGFDSGKATACFNLSATEINQGWGGKVAVWDGAKWVRLATTITTPDETNSAIACATITGSGTYAFIKYVSDPSKLPTCAYDTSIWFVNTWYNAGGRYFYVSMDNLPEGTPAILTFISASPTENYFGFDSVAYATVGNLFETDADFTSSNFSIDGTATVTLQVTAAGCSKILTAQLYQLPD